MRDFCKKFAKIDNKTFLEMGYPMEFNTISLMTENYIDLKILKTFFMKMIKFFIIILFKKIF